MATSRGLAALLLKSSMLLAMVVISYAALLWACHVSEDPDTYLNATLDKIKLLQETPSPRIILVGGSNLAFGLDSAVVKKAFGVPVVNMGLHAGVGLKLMLDEVRPYLKRGDLVVISPEYEHFTGELFFGQDHILRVAALTNDWHLLGGRPPLVLANAALSLNRTIFYHELRMHNQKDALDPIYRRSGFNREGDMIAHLTLQNKVQETPEDTIEKNLNQEALKYLHGFISTNTDHGVTTMVVYPCLERTFYLNHAATIAMIAKAIKQEGIHTLSTPEDFVYDDNLFFNTIYHLNAHGRRLRTEKMIQMLKTGLKNNGFESCGKANLAKTTVTCQ